MTELIPCKPEIPFSFCLEKDKREERQELPDKMTCMATFLNFCKEFTKIYTNQILDLWKQICLVDKTIIKTLKGKNKKKGISQRNISIEVNGMIRHTQEIFASWLTLTIVKFTDLHYKHRPWLVCTNNASEQTYLLSWPYGAVPNRSRWWVPWCLSSISF